MSLERDSSNAAAEPRLGQQTPCPVANKMKGDTLALAVQATRYGTTMGAALETVAFQEPT